MEKEQYFLLWATASNPLPAQVARVFMLYGASHVSNKPPVLSLPKYHFWEGEGCGGGRIFHSYSLDLRDTL